MIISQPRSRGIICGLIVLRLSFCRETGARLTTKTLSLPHIETSCAAVLNFVESRTPARTGLTMPHALSMPAPGFQAIILCGPGSSFPTFTANPDENPKALIPIANRPMVWYPIDFCYRMGVTSEYLFFFPSKFPVFSPKMGTQLHFCIPEVIRGSSSHFISRDTNCPLVPWPSTLNLYQKRWVIKPISRLGDNMP